MLLAAIALTVAVVLGAPGPSVFSAQPASPRSQLPATQPGVSRNEGVFLVTAADDGSRLIYFIAQNTRHSTLASDLQLEQQLNSLWPVRLASRDEVLAFAESAPVGSARTGLLSGPVAADPEPVAEAPVASDTSSVAEALVPSDPATYVLQPGDNLTRLSARFSTTIEAVLAANGMTNANRVYVGQALLIPGAASAVDASVTAPLPDIAESAPVPVAADEPAAEADVPAGGVDAMTYTVKAGDSAIRIARQFGIDVDALLAANGGVANRNRVYVGQVLDIPGA